MNGFIMKYIFGPVPSRRFGLSLGIDIIPRGKKYCTLDCTYCQIGRTTNLTIQRKKYAAVKPVLDELKKTLKSKIRIDCLTFSGSGEPTLNSNIGRMISEIKKLAKIPVVVITNGTLLYRPDVQNDLLKADIVAPSIDAVLSFNEINRPHKSLDIKKIIDGLVRFRKIYRGKIYLEVMLVKNVNDSETEIAAIKKAIKKIKPDKIHLNTVVRPPAETYAKPVEQKKLLEIKKYFGKSCEIISGGTKKGTNLIGTNVPQRILEMLKRRPMQISDLNKTLGVDGKIIRKELRLLERKKKIAKRNGWWVSTR
ncbi:MAG: radical SAM protein [Elusimicrobiota bacterium]|nr:radical SAM protein [Elusimicrobiota bacterium]